MSAFNEPGVKFNQAGRAFNAFPVHLDELTRATWPRSSGSSWQAQPGAQWLKLNGATWPQNPDNDWSENHGERWRR